MNIQKILSAKVDKQTEKSEIIIRFRNGRKIDQRTGSNIFVNPKYFVDGDIYTENLRIITPEVEEANEAKTKLDDLVNSIRTDFITRNKEVAKGWLFDLIDRTSYPDKYVVVEEVAEPATLFEWVDNFITEIAPKRKHPKTGRLFTKNNIEQLKATAKHLHIFAHQSSKEDFNFVEINEDFYNELIRYYQALDFTANTIGKHIKVLKLIVKQSPKELRDLTDMSGFKVFSEEVDNLYLDKDELQQLKDMDFTQTPHLDRVRDWFLLLAWTGSRFSDLQKIGKTDIKDGFISFRQQKTNTKVTIPLHPVVVEILVKYDYNMPEPISNQRFNEYIKEVAERAGICGIESVTRTQGCEVVTTTHPKYELISSHTGRRSFATNMYKDGLPSLTIMSITGHKTERNFLTYIKVSQKEHAEMMAKRWAEIYNK